MLSLRYFTLMFSIISTMALFNYVFSLHVESIHGGEVVDLEIFSYQVGILARTNDSELYKLIGNGGIIAKNLILSAAQCFVNNDGHLRNYTYSITFNTINWKLEPGVIVLIDQIYLPSDGEYYLNNIAVVQVAKDLTTYSNINVRLLEIPFSQESFMKRQGVVSGYGYNWILLLHRNTSRSRIHAGTDDFLRYANVSISRKVKCTSRFQHINTEKQFCGKMLTEVEWQLKGICDNDAGSPLVIDNKIVGLAGFHHKNCDDTVAGIAYTNVSAYTGFVNSIIDNNPLPGTLIHRNRRHFKYSVAPAA